MAPGQRMSFFTQYLVAPCPEKLYHADKEQAEKLNCKYFLVAFC